MKSKKQYKSFEMEINSKVLAGEYQKVCELLDSFDPYIQYIDDYTQYKNAHRNNEYILETIKALTVSKLTFIDTSSVSPQWELIK